MLLSSLGMLLAIDAWAVVLITLFPALLVGFAVGYISYKTVLKKKAQDADTQHAKVIEEARQEAKTIRKDALLEAKEEQIRLRNEFEKESKERRSEMQRQESRLNQKEDSINKKEELLDKKIENIDRTRKDLENKENELKLLEAELGKQNEKMLAELEKVSGMSKEEAKDLIIKEMEEEAKRDAVTIVKDIEKKAKEEGERIAKNIVALAIQRCAVDHASEATVSTVELPNEDMKGRIIGRVGRNIKALESATGVDIIIDDTPDVVTLSSFDPVRREVARLTLQKLVADGRIHPGRIEEVVDKIRREMDAIVKEAGESAVFDAGVYGIHPELVKLLGRMQYRTSYGQNVLKHSLEVSYIAGLLAGELGADVKLCKRAGLLHDIGKSIDHEYEGTHIQIGVELARKYKESKKVIHCIEAHHGDVEANSIEAVLVQAADAISGARPGARRESLEFYIKRLEKLESLANSFAGVEQSFAIQAGREIRVIVKPEQVNDAQTEFLAKDIARKLENELEYPGQIKVNVIREVRKVEYAK